MGFRYHMLPENVFFIIKNLPEMNLNFLRLENSVPAPHCSTSHQPEHKGEFIDLSEQSFDKSG